MYRHLKDGAQQAPYFKSGCKIEIYEQFLISIIFCYVKISIICTYLTKQPPGNHMRKKQELQHYRKKTNLKEETIRLSLDNEVKILLQYLKLMPISIRTQFIHGLKKLADDGLVNSSSQEKIATLAVSCTHAPTFDETRNNYLVDSFFRFLGFVNLPQLFKQFREQTKNNGHGVDRNKELQATKKTIIAFQPKVTFETNQFDSIEATINPNYQNIVKMWRLFTDVHFNNEYKYREINPNYTFYAQPRFLLKMEELREFQNGFSEKGNIIMLTFQGCKIFGKRGIAVIDDKNIYWWEKKSKGIKQIIEELNEQRQKQQSVKQIQKPGPAKKQDKQPIKPFQQEIKNIEPSNFQLFFKIVGHSSKVTSVALSSDQFYLISAGTDRFIKLWCLRSKSLLAEYYASIKTIWSVAFCESGYYFISAGADKQVKLWSTDESKPRRIYLGHKSDVIKADFMKNPDLIISTGLDKQVRIWNTLSAECIKVFICQKPVINFTLSTSGRYMATCDTIGKINIYDFYQGQLLNSFVIPEKNSNPSDTETPKNLKIHDICFSFDQRELTCVSSKYILMYSFDKLCEKPSKNIYDEKNKNNLQMNIATKQVIFTGRDTNIVYCEYHDKGVLVVGSTTQAKY